MRVLFMRENKAFIDEVGFYEACRLVEPPGADEDGSVRAIADEGGGKDG